jgi:hypothetical protein
LDEARSLRPSLLSFLIGLSFGKALPDISDHLDDLLVRKLLHFPVCRSVLTLLWQQRNYQPHILHRIFLPNFLNHLSRMRLAISRYQVNEAFIELVTRTLRTSCRAATLRLKSGVLFFSGSSGGTALSCFFSVSSGGTADFWGFAFRVSGLEFLARWFSCPVPIHVACSFQDYWISDEQLVRCFALSHTACRE